MAKRNADRMFERFSPVSGERLTGRAPVLVNTVDAAPMDAGDSTESGNIRAVRSPTRFAAAMSKLSWVNDVVTEL
jgi:hypothetical protein